MAIDPNADNEYVGISPLSLDDIRNFFDSYIKPYAPYREEKVYNTLMNNLSEYYYGQLYTVIPNELKQIYENANFETPEIYNQLLVAIGVPQSIISGITLSEKLIFLRTLADFERYKGTISFFQKVANTFNERVSIYELFIDKNLVGDWVFKPVSIYLNDDMELNTTEIPYETLYNAVPSLLVSEEQLNGLSHNEQLILPIKSNLLLLDNDLTTNVSILYDVIVAIFLHEYKDNYIDIYFRDNSKTIQLKTFYYFWYYLLTRYYGIPWEELAAGRTMLRFIYSDIMFPAFIGNIPTTIDSLEQIIARYNDIEITSTLERDYDNCRTLRDEFYKDIIDAFATNSGSPQVTANDMYNELLIINPSLITYLDDRIANTSLGEKAEVSLILTELYSSLLLYTSTYSADIYFSQYVDYFLRYLPQVMINPEKTTTYTILYNLKPYHVDLYSTANTGVRCYDKFNQVYIDDESKTNFLYQIVYASLLTFSDDCLFNYIYNTDSSVNLLSIFTFNIFIVLPDDDISSDIYDLHTTKFDYPVASIENISDDYLPSITISPETSIPILSVFSHVGIVLTDTDDESSDMYDEFVTDYQLTKTSAEHMSDDYLPSIILNPETSLPILSVFSHVGIDFSEIDEIVSDMYDEFVTDYKLTKTSVLQATTDYLMELNKELVSDVLCVESYTVTKVL